MEKVLLKKLKDGKFGNVSPARSKTMSAIRGRGNKATEIRLRFMLVRAGIRGWELHSKGIVGNPDFFFPAHRIAVFVDGCFWHGCPICGHVPKTNTDFWKAKIQRNRSRDHENTKKLKKLGIRVVRYWEHELRENPQKCVSKLGKQLSRFSITTL